MPRVPNVSVDSGGVEPDGPDSGRTLTSPWQIGGVDDGVRVAEGLRVIGEVTDAVALRVAVLEGFEVPVWVADTEPVREPVLLRVELDDGVAVSLGVPVRLPVELGEGVPVWLAVRLGVQVGLPEELGEGVPVRLALGVPVRLPVELGEGVSVELLVWLGVPVRLPVELDESVLV